MSQDVLVEIVELCLSIDRKAEEIYSRLSKRYEEKKLSAFWQKMAWEEQSHVTFWEGFLALAREGMIPQVFDSPYDLRDELSLLDARIDVIKRECCRDKAVNKAFVLAYRLEFFLLHPAFEILFHYARNLESATQLKTPETTYEDHITHFIEALNRYGTVSLEMELVGETLLKLWESNRHLAQQGDTDSLTNVLNRRGFFQAVKPLSHLAARNEYVVGVLMADIDDFKSVNDTHGHQRGDQVLREVADCIKAQARSSDVLGRYGGEEFILFMAPMNPEEAAHVGERIREAVADKKPYGLNVTISIGLVCDRLDGDVDSALERLIFEADTSMYRSKKSGKNRVEITTKA